MNTKAINTIIENIIKPDDISMEKCQSIWDGMGKPIGSLGMMEELYIKIAGIRRMYNPSVKKRALAVMCADNGIVSEGVTQTGQEVTSIVAENFFDGKTATSLMCQKLECDMFINDIGMAFDTKRTNRIKTSYGTNNFTKERAMSYADALTAIKEGANLAIRLAKDGYDIIATGEMGIGNTTTSSAVCAAILNESPQIVVGRGAGLSNEGLEKKIETVKKGLVLHSDIINKENYNSKTDWIINVLSAVGGFDICGIMGLYLGGAYAQRPVIIDGFISAVAALCAYNVCENVIDYMIPSHMSAEPASKMIFEALGLSAPINASMRLGEGSGAVMLLPMLDMAQELFDKMGTFDDIGVVPYEKYI